MVVAVVRFSPMGNQFLRKSQKGSSNLILLSVRAEIKGGQADDYNRKKDANSTRHTTTTSTWLEPHKIRNNKYLYGLCV